MRQEDLHHVVAAAAEIVGEDEFVVIGSQSILGSYANAPESLLRSQEADIYPRTAPEKAIRIEGALGDGSYFQQTYGYYAHAVGPETAKAPRGWEDRLVVVNIPPRVKSTRKAVALCLEPHDAVLSKLAANRERDWEFARDAVAAGLADLATLLERVDDLPVDAELRALIRRSLEVFSRARPSDPS